MKTCSATVVFQTANDAKLAFSGLNKYKVDQEGRELRVRFTS